MRVIAPSMPPNAGLGQGRRRLAPRCCSTGEVAAFSLVAVCGLNICLLAPGRAVRDPCRVFLPRGVTTVYIYTCVCGSAPAANLSTGHIAARYKAIALYICRIFFFPGCEDAESLPALTNCSERCGAAGNGPGATIKCLLRTMSDAAGNGLGTTFKYPRRTTSGAACSGLGATVINQPRATSGDAGSGLGTTIKYLLGAIGIDLGTTAK